MVAEQGKLPLREGGEQNYGIKKREPVTGEQERVDRWAEILGTDSKGARKRLPKRSPNDE